MKIAILDGYTTNPGDLSWENFEKLGDVCIHDWTNQDDVIERLQDATAAFTNKVMITREHLAALPKLKYIGVLATGYDTIDIEAAKEYGVVVTNVPVYANYSVPQLTFALILELCYHIEKHSRSVTEDLYWSKNTYNSYWLNPIIGLEGKTLGVVGMGHIGQQVANIGIAFGMRILAYDIFQRELPNVEWVDLEGLLSKSDIVTLHCPLFDTTRGLINEGTLTKMKSSAFLINTSRGPLVVDEDLAVALNNGMIAAAGLDVLNAEPPKKDNPLLKAKNVIITPHIGWATVEARKGLINTAVSSFKAYLMGQCQNVVS